MMKSLLVMVGLGMASAAAQGTTLSVAVVNNPDMVTLQKQVKDFNSTLPCTPG